ncbi:unnamed protein product [Orchesella dallaii]|uniref:Uncharacterized protein n=1 Tax=Orchesella dallaii TaxID=48710 RepID=A0ABP1R0F4_9HEXA
MSLIDVGFKPPSYKTIDDFLQMMSSASANTFHPIPARHLVSRYMITDLGFDFDIPAGTTRKFRYLQSKPVSIGLFWYHHVGLVKRQYCSLVIINNTEGYAALLDNNPSTDMIQVVQRFLQAHCSPDVMNDFRIVDMPSFANPILRGSSLLAALAVYNYVHEDTVALTVHGRFPSEYELYQVGYRAFSGSFRRMCDGRIIANLSHEVPEALEAITDRMWERFGHPVIRNGEVPEPIEDRELPNEIVWLPEVEAEQEDGEYGYDDGFDSDDTVENEPQVISRLNIRDRNRLVWALLNN